MNDNCPRCARLRVVLSHQIARSYRYLHWSGLIPLHRIDVRLVPGTSSSPGLDMPRYGDQLPRAFQRRYPPTPHRTAERLDIDTLVKELSAALRLWPSEIDLVSPHGLVKMEGCVHRALREQRRRSIAGHWSYDIACHARLLELHRHIIAGKRLPMPPSEPLRRP